MTLRPLRLLRPLTSFRSLATMDTSIPEKIRITSHLQYNVEEHLTPAGVLNTPLEQFKDWFRFAHDHGVPEPEEMAIATATKSGIPSCRMVLLKEVDTAGFVFFTNYDSRKSQEISENPVAAITFYWRNIHRQVRVVGRVEKLGNDESIAYYNSRPLGSRLGAWASPQSKQVEEGEVQARYEEFKAKYVGEKDVTEAEVPKPEHWGGWRIIPS